jgi:hypothetical protein
VTLRATGVEPLPSRIVLYAVGSPVVVDFEETLGRAGVPLRPPFRTSTATSTFRIDRG